MIWLGWRNGAHKEKGKTMKKLNAEQMKFFTRALYNSKDCKVIAQYMIAAYDITHADFALPLFLVVCECPNGMLHYVVQQSDTLPNATYWEIASPSMD